MYLDVEDGIALHVQVLEGAQRTSRAPVVMLHGLCVGNMATWYFTTAAALAAERKVVLFDLRGHGLSSRAPSGYDLGTMTGDLSRVLDATMDASLDGPAIVVGHSYGAVVAMKFAMEHPERVSKLVVVEAPLPPTGLRELDEFLGRDPSHMLEALPAPLFEAIASGTRSGRRFVETMRFLSAESTLFSDLKAARDFSDAELATLTCPLLAVYGTRSSCRNVGQRIANHCPESTLVELEGGHFLPLECPAALTAAITSFTNG